MSKLNDQRQRLYPVCPEGQTRTLALHFARASDWPAVAALYQAMQEALELPAPAISISGTTGFGVWVSLAVAVPATQAAEFLAGLQQHYLAEIPARHLTLQAVASPPTIPALVEDTGKWSAFIDPTLGDMFIDEPWLEMAPNPEKQADILASLRSIPRQDFQRVLAQWQVPAIPQGEEKQQSEATLSLGGEFTDPRSFLLAVMNDTSVSLALRVEAAKALLPYARQ